MNIFAYKSWLHCSHCFLKIISQRVKFIELKVTETVSSPDVPIWPFFHLPQEGLGCGVFSFPVGGWMALWMGARWEESFGVSWAKPVWCFSTGWIRLYYRWTSDLLNICGEGKGALHSGLASLRWPLLGHRAAEVPSGQAFARGGVGRGPRGCNACERGKERNPNHFQLFLCRSNLLSIPTFTCNGNRFAF